VFWQDGRVFFKLVACDLDGTLLGSDGTLSERTRRALTAVQAAGAMVVACTARPVRWVRPVAAQFGGASVAVCVNGAVTWDLDEDEALSEFAIEAGVVSEVVATLTALFPGGAWAVERTHTFAHEPGYRPLWPVPPDTRVAAVSRLLTEPPVKLMFRHEGLSPDEMLAPAQRALEGLVELSHSNSADGLLEISAAGIDKGSALARLCDSAGIDRAEVIAFGDMPNDLSLLAWAGTAVAVANAHPDVLAVAAEVTRSNDDDGVAVVLERLLASSLPQRSSTTGSRERFRTPAAPRRPEIVLVTASQMPKPDPESGLVIAALADVGIHAELHPWDKPYPFSDVPLVVCRTPWNYFNHARAFLEWASGVAAATAFENPIELVRWNAHKSYLLDLEAAGVPVVPTRLVSSTATPAQRAQALGTETEVVIKPAISGGAQGALRTDPRDPQAGAHLSALLQSGEALVQPFLSAVQAGEVSLIYFQSAFSHAVLKTPAGGDYRVQAQYGGTVAVYDPAPRELALGTAALNALPQPPLYARIDMVGGDEPRLMEAELIEPELFLPLAPGAAVRYAHGLAARLKSH
jgi:hydroxymethylpyrimidine pyrophosphatase-like HAD family hydrolase